MPRQIEAERAAVPSSGCAGSAERCWCGGAPRGNRNALKHGNFTAEATALKRQISALARMARKTVAGTDLYRTSRRFADCQSPQAPSDGDWQAPHHRHQHRRHHSGDLQLQLGGQIHGVLRTRCQPQRGPARGLSRLRCDGDHAPTGCFAGYRRARLSALAGVGISVAGDDATDCRCYRGQLVGGEVKGPP
jgi:hypothetical protein